MTTPKSKVSEDRRKLREAIAEACKPALEALKAFNAIDNSQLNSAIRAHYIALLWPTKKKGGER